MPGLTKIKEVSSKTPFGKPSDAYVLGTLEGRKVASWRATDADTAFCPAS